LEDELNDIIKGCQRKKYRYQKKLYDRYASLLYAICFRYFKNADNANDALQEGFIKIYDKIEAYRGDGSFEGWIKRVQVNICLMEFRKNKKTYALEDEVIDESFAEQEDEDDLYSIEPQVLFGMIKELSDGYRTVFNMYVLDGYSHKEISEYLSISEGTSKSQLARAKKILRKQVLEMMKKQG
jgi:RNA polymerase sigma factor (sigma-70 family)